MSTMGWSGCGRTAERTSWWLMRWARLGEARYFAAFPGRGALVRALVVAGVGTPNRWGPRPPVQAGFGLGHLPCANFFCPPPRERALAPDRNPAVPCARAQGRAQSRRPPQHAIPSVAPDH